MDVPLSGRVCPKCGSSDYVFRSRKKIIEVGKPEEVETKYRCKTCTHVWRERQPSAGSRHGQPRNGLAGP
jgi:rubredoxin